MDSTATTIFIFPTFFCTFTEPAFPKPSQKRHTRGVRVVHMKNQLKLPNVQRCHEDEESESFSTRKPLEKSPDGKDKSMHSTVGGISCLLSRGSEGVKDGGERQLAYWITFRAITVTVRGPLGLGVGRVDGRRGSMRGLGTRRPLTFSPT